MGERLNLPDVQKEAKVDARKNSFRATLASLGFVLVGNPNVDYRAVVDNVCDRVEIWGMKVRRIFDKKNI